MSKRTSGSNSAQFLMDGEDFFAAFVECLDEVKRSATDKSESLSKPEDKSNVPTAVPENTYVRLAYWAMDPHLPLKIDEPAYTLEVALKELADLGVHVEIILWDPDLLTGNVGGSDNFATKVSDGNHLVDKLLHGYKDKILVYLEGHPARLTKGVGLGLHQKMALFSVRGKLKALVGGFNMEEEYWDTAYHHGKHPITDKGHTLHDTAVLVKGPVTLDIEEEWLRRWDRQVSSDSFMVWKGPPRYKVRGKVRGLLKDQPQSGGLAISVLTTGVSALGTEHSIRDEIKTLLQGATSYVYAENYQFFEPEIVTEICRKLKTQKQFQVCVVIPDQACDPSHANTQLSRIAYTRMLLASFKEKQGTKGKLDETLRSLRLQEAIDPVNNEQGVYYKVLDAKKPKSWMEGAKLQMRPAPVEGQKGVSKPLEVALELIDGVDLTEGETPRVQFYCPVRFPSNSDHYDASTKIYVHSKLMIIDSRHVIVGSANFGHRSMQYDGEMSLHIHSDAFAIEVKQKLFPHYNVHSQKEVPAALRDDAHHAYDQVRLIPRSPGDFKVLKEKLPFAMDYSWF
ncbi:phospholipase D-like domain-containing protein [Corallococcus sp. bb12-1]|uniref:phospholipase D-like domain-containing protein n=1 Tax=Corallococcus sp. bb12-1 TaxID=2996784 RepID=UPI00226FD7C4|nr:phospholipase D-like domain-containing protein [Corallococcus sp. bb12-1]MCY1042089.1 phospholipase D-like domain-containing protein [Corallococcus sp. bb12-1]